MAFTIDNLGYIGTGGGEDRFSNLRDFWEFCDTCYVSTSEIGISRHFLVYPNPASHHLYIINPDTRNESWVEIYNIFGSLAFSQTFKGNIEMDISNLDAGFYIIHFLKDDNFYSTKLIIER